MKQINTGAGLVALSVGMVATAFIATRHSGSEAFAQVAGGARRIVSAGLHDFNGWTVAYCMWSDNSIVRPLHGKYLRCCCPFIHAPRACPD